VERKHHRYPVDRDATIIFGAQKINCKVRNSSHGGAMLELPYSEWLPQKFELQDASVKRLVALVWQGSEYVGIRYLDELPRQKLPVFGRRRR